MLTLLLPYQVNENWPQIRGAIERSFPPSIEVTEEVLVNTQMALTSGQAQAWILYASESQDTSNIRAIAITTIVFDPVSGVSDLLLYGLAGNFMKDSSNGYLQLWMEGLEGLKKYARKNGCRHITFFTRKANATRLAQQVGADVENIYGYIGVSNESL